MLYRGPLYRALNPVYAREPLSGRGAELYGGRFNPRGVPALYCSLTVLAALREANRVGSFQPVTLVSYDAEIDGVFDGRDEAALKAKRIDAAALADNGWREQMKSAGEARTQSFARNLIHRGFRGLLIRSFAPGATDRDLHLVLWQWGNGPPARLTLIDDEGRLPDEVAARYWEGPRRSALRMVVATAEHARSAPVRTARFPFRSNMGGM